MTTRPDAKNPSFFWNWKCDWCDEHGSSPTRREAEDARRAHQICHIDQVMEEQVHQGILERCGQSDGKTLYRLTAFGKAFRPMTRWRAPSRTEH